MDTTAIGIILGLLATALFAFFEFRRRGHHVDVHNNAINIVLVFLSAHAIPPFAQLIWAAIFDDPNNMPSGWRVYLPAAAVAGVWIAGAHLYQIFSKILKGASRPENKLNEK